MKVVFELSMPGVNTWNGRSSFDGGYFAVVRDFGRGKAAAELAARVVAGGSYGYDFGDGWYARIHVREVDAGEARACRRRSQGRLR